MLSSNKKEKFYSDIKIILQNTICKCSIQLSRTSVASLTPEFKVYRWLSIDTLIMGKRCKNLNYVKHTTVSNPILNVFSILVILYDKQFELYTFSVFYGKI